MPTPEYEALNKLSQPPSVMSANLPIVPEADAPDDVETLYAHFRSHFNRPSVPGILQCFATHPPLLEHMMGLSETMLFTEGALGRQHKELIATFVSATNQCAYCTDSHGFFLRVHGGSDEVLEAALTCNPAAPALTSQQQALLTFAQKVNGYSASVKPTDVEALRTHGFTDLQIAEAIHITALFATFNRVVNAFGLSSQNRLLLPQTNQ